MADARTLVMVSLLALAGGVGWWTRGQFASRSQTAAGLELSVTRVALEGFGV